MENDPRETYAGRRLKADLAIIVEHYTNNMSASAIASKIGRKRDWVKSKVYALQRRGLLGKKKITIDDCISPGNGQTPERPSAAARSCVPTDDPSDSRPAKFIRRTLFIRDDYSRKLTDEGEKNGKGAMAAMLDKALTKYFADQK